MEPIWFAVTAVIRIQKESDPKQIDPDEMKMASIEVSDIVWGGRLIVPRWIFSLVYMVYVYQACIRRRSLVKGERNMARHASRGSRRNIRPPGGTSLAQRIYTYI